MQCDICQSEDFIAGFQGRMTYGKPPLCANCGGAERHRIVHQLFSAIKHLSKDWKMLQFAPDRSVQRSWFAAYDGSIYGGENSLNMMDTGLLAGAYDIILSNHVLEHVPDDTAAVQEMLRIVGPKGIVAMTVPTPGFRWSSIDWGYADDSKNEHYRDYGADFPSVMTDRISGLRVLAAISRDDVTGLYDQVYFMSFDPLVLKSLAEVWQSLGHPLVSVYR